METVKSSVSRGRLVIAVNTAEFFLSHRLHLAKGARDAGFEVWALCPNSPAVARIKELGFFVKEVEMGRKSMNPFSEFKTVFEMYKAVKEINPVIYHGFTVKPVLYGTFVCRILKVPRIIDTITGLGFLFLSKNVFVRAIREVVGSFYRILFHSPRVKVIFQNEDDRDYFLNRKWIRSENCTVIKGTGVDLQRFQEISEPATEPVIVFPARLLLDKGINELVAAADLLAQKGLQFTLDLCGKEDPGNPSGLSAEGIQKLKEKGKYIRIRGHVDDMAKAFQNCHIVCLPSYREGIPLALIEASACGRPIVTTDVPGCRSVVTDGVEGFLVPARSVAELAQALENLILSKELRRQMGQQARSRAVKEFAKETVVQKNIEIYNRALSPEKHSTAS